jgi:hypothetical protein
MQISDIESIRESAFKPLNTIESPGRIAYAGGISAACERVIIEIRRIAGNGYLSPDTLTQINLYCADQSDFSPIDDFDKGLKDGFIQIKQMVVRAIAGN